MEKYTVKKEGNKTTIIIHDKELGQRVSNFFKEMKKKKKERHQELYKKYLENKSVMASEKTC